MTATIKPLMVLTKELFDHLETKLPVDIEGRDRYIERVEHLLESREAVIKAIDHPPNTDEEKVLVSKINDINQGIEKRLNALMINMKNDIYQIHVKKRNNKKYDNPYDGPTNEGAFIDKRGI